MARNAPAAVATPERKNPTAGESSADTSGAPSWLLCRAGTHLCAMPLEHVVEIMRVLPIEAVAGAPHYVHGLCVIRGLPVPVLDAGLLIGDHATRPERLVTIRIGDRTIALAVEGVLGIRSIMAGAIRQLPPLLRHAAAETIAAIGTLDAELLFFLNTARIVPEDVLERLGAEGAAS